MEFQQDSLGFLLADASRLYRRAFQRRLEGSSITLAQAEETRQKVNTIIGQRALLQQYLAGLSYVVRIYPSDANFLLVQVKEARALYEFLLARGIIVRDRSKQPLCGECLRLSLGTPEENEHLWKALLAYEDETNA